MNCFVFSFLGDRNHTSAPYQMKLGDCFRLGSVGLVVSEIKTATGDEQRLDAKTLQMLKDENTNVSFFDSHAFLNDDIAPLAADESVRGITPSPSRKNSTNNNDNKISLKKINSNNSLHGIGSSLQLLTPNAIQNAASRGASNDASILCDNSNNFYNNNNNNINNNIIDNNIDNINVSSYTNIISSSKDCTKGCTVMNPVVVVAAHSGTGGVGNGEVKTRHNTT